MSNDHVKLLLNLFLSIFTFSLNLSVNDILISTFDMCRHFAQEVSNQFLPLRDKSVGLFPQATIHSRVIGH